MCTKKQNKKVRGPGVDCFRLLLLLYFLLSACANLKRLYVYTNHTHPFYCAKRHSQYAIPSVLHEKCQEDAGDPMERPRRERGLRARGPSRTNSLSPPPRFGDEGEDVGLLGTRKARKVLGIRSRKGSEEVRFLMRS